jgi:hypothetical protein
VKPREAKLYQIPDIHGRLDLLELLLAKLRDRGLDLAVDRLVFTGDLVDRGPDSRGVIELVRRLQADHPGSVVALKGNHEEMMLRCVDGDGGQFSDWQCWTYPGNGGQDTLKSFTPEPGADWHVPEDVLAWLRGLPISHEEPGFFFSHAPAPAEEDRPRFARGQPLTKDELLWNYVSLREEPEARRHGEGVVGVCGHIHRLMGGAMEPRFYDHYIFGDTGSGCHPDAPLVAIEVRSREVVYARPTELPEAKRADAAPPAV